MSEGNGSGWKGTDEGGWRVPLRGDCALRRAIKGETERRQMRRASTAAEAEAATWAEVGERTIATRTVRLRGTWTKEVFRFQPLPSQSHPAIKTLIETIRIALKQEPRKQASVC